MSGRIRIAGLATAWTTATVLGVVLATGFAQAENAVPAPAAQAQAQAQAESASPRPTEPGRSGSPRASASPRPSRSPKPKPTDERRRDERRRRHHGRVLHGETVVATDNGTETHVVQRGVVTAVRGNTFTVRSSDGFTLTWTRNADTQVRNGRDEQSSRAVAVGDRVGVHGVRRNASTVVARHVRIAPEDGERPKRSPSAAPA